MSTLRAPMSRASAGPVTAIRPPIATVVRVGDASEKDAQELLESLNQSSGSTIVLVTHDMALAERAGRLIRLKDGAVVEDRVKGAQPPAA